MIATNKKRDAESERLKTVVVVAHGEDLDLDF